MSKRRVVMDVDGPQLDLLERHGSFSDNTLKGSLNDLLLQVAMLARAGSLPPIFGQTWREVSRQWGEEIRGKPLEPLPEKRGPGRPPDVEQPDEHAERDFPRDWLEIGSKRSKAGYAGVSVAGEWFRAITREGYLVKRRSPVRAAIDRYRWFEQKGEWYPPAGNLFQWHLDHGASPRDAIEQILQEIENPTPGLLRAYPDAMIKAQVMAYVAREKAKGIELLSPPKPAQAPKAYCLVCKEEITDTADFSIVDDPSPTPWAHRACAFKHKPLTKS